MVEQTSLLAYAQIKSKLGAMQQAVYDTINELGPISNLEIADKLKKPINSITPRVNELVKFGFVTLHGIGTNSLGHSAKLWVVKDPNDDALAKKAKEFTWEQTQERMKSAKSRSNDCEV